MVKLDEIRPRVYVYETAGPGALAWLRSCWERVFFGPKQYELEDLGERGLAFRCTLDQRFFGPTPQQEEKALATFKQAWEKLKDGWARILGNLSAQERENAPRYFDFLQLKTILPIYAPDGRYIEAWQALYELSLPLAPAQDSLSRPPRVLLEGEYLSLELRGNYLAKAVFAHLPVQARRGSDLFAERFAQPTAMLFKRVNGRFLAPFFMGENGASPACKEAVAVGEMEDERPVPYSSFFGKPAIILLDVHNVLAAEKHQQVLDINKIGQDNPAHKIDLGDLNKYIKRSASALQSRCYSMGLNIEIIVKEGSVHPMYFQEFQDFLRKNNYPQNPFNFYVYIANEDDFKVWADDSEYYNDPLGMSGNTEVIGQAQRRTFCAKIHFDQFKRKTESGWAKVFRTALNNPTQGINFINLWIVRHLTRVIEHEVLHNKIDLHPLDGYPDINAGGHVDGTIMQEKFFPEPFTEGYDEYMYACLLIMHGDRTKFREFTGDEDFIADTSVQKAWKLISSLWASRRKNKPHKGLLYNPMLFMKKTDLDILNLYKEPSTNKKVKAVRFELLAFKLLELARVDTLEYSKIRIDIDNRKIIAGE